MTTLAIRYYISASGVYLGAWDGNPPDGAVEVVDPPLDARQVWNFVTETWGAVPPPPPPDIISRRQFFQALASPTLIEAVTGTDETIISEAEAEAALEGVIPAPLETIILTLPVEQRFAARMLVKGATEFSRCHPLSEVVRSAVEWTQPQQDAFWRLAHDL